MRKLILICCLFIGIVAKGQAQTSTDPEEKAKGLQKELKLSDHQTTKVAAIYKESSQKFEKIKVAEHGNTNKMTAAIAPLRKATIKKIKAVLTPSQAAKYDKLISDPKHSGASGWSDGWSPASS